MLATATHFDLVLCGSRASRHAFQAPAANMADPTKGIRQYATARIPWNGSRVPRIASPAMSAKIPNRDIETTPKYHAIRNLIGRIFTFQFKSVAKNA